MKHQSLQVQAYLDSLSFWDSAPAAFGVVRSLGTNDFVWVYANAALEQHFSQGIGTLQGMAYRTIFPNGSDEWPLLMHTTIQTAKSRSVTHYSSVLQKTLYMQTYCPLPDLCACFVQDVSARVRMAQKTQAAQQRIHLILHNTTDSVFDFDLPTRTLRNHADAVQRHGAPAVIDNAPKTMLDQGLLREAGAAAFTAAINAIEGGSQEQAFELELRFQPDAALVWCVIKLLCYTEVHTQRPAVIGYVRNIDKRRRQNERLREAAERDSLTGLFNRGAAELRAIPLLQQPQAFAFFVFDVDDFKSMNDSCGHAYGDTMLLRFAQALRGSFRQEELVWRHGGDEFCACIFGVSGRSVLAKRCEQVLKCFALARETIAGERMPNAAPTADAVQGKPHCSHTAAPTCSTTSCSIGVAYGMGPHSYGACFAAADAALFTTKQRGKNGFTIVELPIEQCN